MMYQWMEVQEMIIVGGPLLLDDSMEGLLTSMSVCRIFDEPPR